VKYFKYLRIAWTWYQGENLIIRVIQACALAYRAMIDAKQEGDW
jgi:hypothetical protein